MIIIGEKINGTRKKVAEAITARNSDSIRALVVEQTEAGSAYPDINAGTAPGREPEDMVRLIENAQVVSELPVCLDSANPPVLRAGPELDSAIADPNDRALLETTMAAEMLMGRDRFCMGFTKAYRAGRIAPPAK